MKKRQIKSKLNQIVYYNCRICLVTEIDGFGNISQLTHVDHNSYECIERDIIQERIFSPSIIVMQSTQFIEKYKATLFKVIESSKYSNRINKSAILDEIERFWYELLICSSAEDEVTIRSEFMKFINEYIVKIEYYYSLLSLEIGERNVFV